MVKLTGVGLGAILSCSRKGGKEAEMTEKILSQLNPKQKLDLREAINALISQPGPVREAYLRQQLVRKRKEREQHEPAPVRWSLKNHAWYTPQRPQENAGKRSEEKDSHNVGEDTWPCSPGKKS